MRKRLKKFEDIVIALKDESVPVYDDKESNVQHVGMSRLSDYKVKAQFWIDEEDYNRLFKKKSKWIKCDPVNMPDLKGGEYKVKLNNGSSQVSECDPIGDVNHWGKDDGTGVYITHYKPIKKKKKKIEVSKLSKRSIDRINKLGKTTPKISDFVRAGYAKEKKTDEVGYFQVSNCEGVWLFYVGGIRFDEDYLLEYYTPITKDELANMIDKGE